MLKECPFSPFPKALMTVGKEPFPTIYVDSQKENEVRWARNVTESDFVRKLSLEYSGPETPACLLAPPEVGCYL